METQSLHKQPDYRKTVQFVGVLFLVQMITAFVSHVSLLEPVLGSRPLLPAVAINADTVRLGMLLDLVCGAAVFGISVLLFPVFKIFNESIALWYVGLRLHEWIGMLVSGIFLLTLVSVGTDYMKAGPAEQSQLQVMGTYLLKARGKTKILMLLGYCLSAVMFYYLLWRWKLLPAFIPIWGLVGVLLLFIEIISNVYGSSVGGITIMMPLGINEMFLGFWLIFKGFNKQALR